MYMYNILYCYRTWCEVGVEAGTETLISVLRIFPILKKKIWKNLLIIFIFDRYHSSQTAMWLQSGAIMIKVQHIQFSTEVTRREHRFYFELTKDTQYFTHVQAIGCLLWVF